MRVRSTIGRLLFFLGVSICAPTAGAAADDGRQDLVDALSEGGRAQVDGLLGRCYRSITANFIGQCAIEMITTEQCSSKEGKYNKQLKHSIPLDKLVYGSCHPYSDGGYELVIKAHSDDNVIHITGHEDDWSINDHKKVDRWDDAAFGFIKDGDYHSTIDQAFKKVIEACRPQEERPAPKKSTNPPPKKPSKSKR